MKKNNNVIANAMVQGSEFAVIEKKTAKSVRAFGKAFADVINSDLGATCAAVNTHLDDAVELDGVSMTCRKWLSTFGIDLKKTKKGLTAAVLKAVWNKEMMDGGDMCRWQIVPATIGDKVVYEYVETKTKKGHKVVGKFHKVRVSKWSVTLLFRLLQESWNFAKVYNAIKDNEEHLASVKTFYVVKSESASRKGSKSEMMAVKDASKIEW